MKTLEEMTMPELCDTLGIELELKRTKAPASASAWVIVNYESEVSA